MNLELTALCSYWLSDDKFCTTCALQHLDLYEEIAKKFWRTDIVSSRMRAAVKESSFFSMYGFRSSMAQVIQQRAFSVDFTEIKNRLGLTNL